MCLAIGEESAEQGGVQRVVDGDQVVGGELECVRELLRQLPDSIEELEEYGRVLPAELRGPLLGGVRLARIVDILGHLAQGLREHRAAVHETMPHQNPFLLEQHLHHRKRRPHENL